MKWQNWILIAAVMVSTSGCVRMILPTSVEEIEKRAFEGQREILVDVDYVEAYRNMKRYYDKCLNDTVSQYQTSSVDSKLERDKGTAQFVGLEPFGTYSFVINLSDQGEGKTLIRYLRPLPKGAANLFLGKQRQQNILVKEFKFLEKLSKLNPEDWNSCSQIR